MIETPRLTLRGWQDGDAAPFEAMGRDPRVMAHFPALMIRSDVVATIARQRAMLKALGHCFWAIERRSDRRFLGFCGIQPGPEGTPIADLPEIGWRLARDHWGQGYAREAAEASLAWMWAHRDAASVFAITVPDNVRSRALTTRIGMAQVEDGDFDHPALPPGHRLRRHVLYAIDRPVEAQATPAR